MLPLTQFRISSPLPQRNTHPTRPAHKFYTNTSTPGPSLPVNILKFSKEELREDLRLTFNLTSQEWVSSQEPLWWVSRFLSPNRVTCLFYPWLLDHRGYVYSYGKASIITGIIHPTYSKIGRVKSPLSSTRRLQRDIQLMMDLPSEFFQIYIW